MGLQFVSLGVNFAKDLRFAEHREIKKMQILPSLHSGPPAAPQDDIRCSVELNKVTSAQADMPGDFFRSPPGTASDGRQGRRGRGPLSSAVLPHKTKTTEESCA